MQVLDSFNEQTLWSPTEMILHALSEETFAQRNFRNFSAFDQYFAKAYSIKFPEIYLQNLRSLKTRPPPHNFLRKYNSYNNETCTVS